MRTQELESFVVVIGSIFFPKRLDCASLSQIQPYFLSAAFRTIFFIIFWCMQNNILQQFVLQDGKYTEQPRCTKFDDTSSVAFVCRRSANERTWTIILQIIIYECDVLVFINAVCPVKYLCFETRRCFHAGSLERMTNTQGLNRKYLHKGTLLTQVSSIHSLVSDWIVHSSSRV